MDIMLCMLFNYDCFLELAFHLKIMLNTPGKNQFNVSIFYFCKCYLCIELLAMFPGYVWNANTL